MSIAEDPGVRAAQHEYELEQAIGEAVLAADRIILEASDGSAEETNFLTARVAQRFVEKCLIAATHELNKRNLGFSSAKPSPKR